MSYLCRNGHRHKTQDRATNCCYCKRNERLHWERIHRMQGLGIMDRIYDKPQRDKINAKS